MMGDLNLDKLQTFLSVLLPMDDGATWSSTLESQMPSLVESISKIGTIVSGAAVATDGILTKEFTIEFDRCYSQGKGSITPKEWIETWFAGSTNSAANLKQINEFFGYKSSRFNVLEGKLAKLLDPFFPNTAGQTMKAKLILYGFTIAHVELLYDLLPKPADVGSPTTQRDYMAVILAAVILHIMRTCPDDKLSSSCTTSAVIENVKPVSTPEMSTGDLNSLVGQPLTMEMLTSIMAAIKVQESAAKSGAGTQLRNKKVVTLPSGTVAESGEDTYDEDSVVDEDDEDGESSGRKTPQSGTKDLNLLKSLSTPPRGTLPSASDIIRDGGLVLVESLDWLMQNELYYKGWVVGVNTFIKESKEFSARDFESALGSKDGLVLFDILGHPFLYVFKSTKAGHQVAPICSIFNPDVHPVLSSLGRQPISMGLLPSTPANLLGFLAEQMSMCHDLSAIDYKQSTGKSRYHVLFQFNQKMINVMDKLRLTGTGDILDRFHLTSMATVMVFFVNRWMRAILNKDLNYLLIDFDVNWANDYKDLTEPSGPSNIPKMNLKVALFILGYLCDKCNTRGAHMDLCCVKCDIDKSGGDKNGGSNKSKIVGSGDTLTKVAYELYKQWRAALTGDAKKRSSLADYIRIKGITVANGLVVKTGTNTEPVSKVVAGDLYERNAKDQSLVKMQRCLYSSG
jgi:hypothetical protein